MKITLINPSSQNISAFGVRSLSSFLKTRGHTVNVIVLPIIPDVYRNRKGYLYARNYQYSPRILDQTIEIARRSDLVGISFMTQYYHCAVQLTEAMKKALSVPIVWGGVHPTIRPEDSLQYADFVCMGEGEEALAEFAGRLEAGREYSDLPNFCFLQRGMVVRNPVRPLIQDIDSLPFLDYGPENHYVRDVQADSLKPFGEDMFERFLAVVPYYKNMPLKSFMYFTTRGCPYSCTYCVNDFYRSMYGTHGFIRKLSVERVINELESVLRIHPCIEEIEFCDDNFALRPTSEIERFSELYKKRIGLPFQLLISPQNINEEKLEPLLEAGLVFVETGIQSVAETSSELYHRSTGEQQLLKAASILNKYRNRMAPPCYHLILDNPFERTEDTLKTFELTLKLPRPFWFKRSSLVPFPGILVYEKFKEAGLIENEELEVYCKILEMPSTSYINFLFLLNNQNYPIRLLQFLARPGFVAVFNRESWIPVLGFAERGIRLASKITRWTKVLLRGDWGSIRKRISMIGKMPQGVPSSRPPAA